MPLMVDRARWHNAWRFVQALTHDHDAARYVLLDMSHSATLLNQIGRRTHASMSLACCLMLVKVGSCSSNPYWPKPPPGTSCNR